jgi:hypothetical protein
MKLFERTIKTNAFDDLKRLRNFFFHQILFFYKNQTYFAEINMIVLGLLF